MRKEKKLHLKYFFVLYIVKKIYQVFVHLTFSKAFDSVPVFLNSGISCKKG